jgi:hypothetical protein
VALDLLALLADEKMATGRRNARRLARALCAAVLLVAGGAHAQQELGQKTLGTQGLKAGAQPETGIYLGARYLYYRAVTVDDRNGNALPVGLRLRAMAGSFGALGTYKIRRIATYVNAAVAVPVAAVSFNTEVPEAALDRWGLADVYIQPLRLGWRVPHLDLVTGYAFYIPTGRVEPGGRTGVSRAQWSHELSLGTAIYFDRERTWHLSALAGYELNERKLGIDITRGDSINIQGGAGKTSWGLFDLGVVGYALWQVRDDRGSAVPRVLAGVRSRVYGVGFEADVDIDKLRSRIGLRYLADFGAEARPSGQVVVLGLTVVAWHPRPPRRGEIPPHH